jgi:Ca-activated chloride channel family protein
MYELAHPFMLVLLLLPAVLWWLLPPHRETTSAIRLPFFQAVAQAAGIEPMQGAVIPRRSRLQLVAEILAWCLMVLALSRPQLIEPPVIRTESQRDILLALDLSQSMEKRDFAAPDGILTTRIDAVKAVVSDFVRKRSGDRLGLIVFGDAPYPLAPFTMDHALVNTLISSLQPGVAGPRTALGDAVGLAIRMFEQSTVPEKVLILLSDGNDTASRMPPLKAAEIAHDNHIVLHTVAIGDPAATGEDKVDTATLDAMATQTGGRSFFGQDQAGLAAIYSLLDQITPKQQKQLSWRPRRELFYYPALAALGLLIVSLLAGAQSHHRLRRTAS